MKCTKTFVLSNKAHQRVMAATTEALSAVRAAKQELRKKLRQLLTAMTDHQRKEESDKLVRKVQTQQSYQQDSEWLLHVLMI